MTVIKILLWIWQLPQNIVGWFLTIGKSTEILRINNKELRVWYRNLDSKRRGEAVTLGEYIIIDSLYSYPGLVYSRQETVKHEYGHVIQSRMLGPLYLIVIGICSILHAWYNVMIVEGAESIISFLLKAGQIN